LTSSRQLHHYWAKNCLYSTAGITKVGQRCGRIQTNREKVVRDELLIWKASMQRKQGARAAKKLGLVKESGAIDYKIRWRTKQMEIFQQLGCGSL